LEWVSHFILFCCLYDGYRGTYAMDAVASMAEEVHDPTRQLPLALTWAIPISFILGLIYLLPILFTLPDIPTLINGNTFSPQKSLPSVDIYVFSCRWPTGRSAF